MTEPISEYPCPAGDGMVHVTTERQRRAIANGNHIYHSQECQKAAAQETRPCCVCGTPVTRRRSEFKGGRVTCPEHRGGWKINKQTYECANPGCTNTVERTPANVIGAVYCSRACTQAANRRLDEIEASCAGCGVTFTARGTSPVAQVKAGKPVYHSKECRRQATRVYFPCAACGDTIWRYWSVVGKDFDHRQHRIFCPPCHKQHGAKKPNGDTRPCEWCLTPVYRRPSQDDGGPRYCGHECWGEALKKAQTGDPKFRACAICETPFLMHVDRVRQDVKTCSRKCAGKLRRRKPGDRYVDDKGYVWITTPGGRSVFEHRYVMEQHLGRPLLPGETVHHKKGGFEGRSNNAIENLELWTGNHPKGHRVEDVVQYAREILGQYGDDGERERYSR